MSRKLDLNHEVNRSEPVVPSIKKFYKDFFSRQEQVHKWGEIYKSSLEEGVRLRLEQTNDWVSELGLSGSNCIILDIGCGNGATIRALRKRNYKIIGLDQALPMLKKAKAESNSALSESEFLQGDIEALPFKTASIDCVICLGVLPYLASVDIAIAEMSRVLRRQGILIFSFHRRIILVEYFHLFYSKITKIFSSNIKSHFWLQRHSLKLINKLIKENGLKLIQTVVLDYNHLSISWHKLISIHLARGLNHFFKRFSHWPIFKNLGDMYLMKAEKDSCNGKFNRSQLQVKAK